MQKILAKLFAFAIVVVIALAAASPALALPPEPEVDCEAAGGVWISTDATHGECHLGPDSALFIGTCDPETDSGVVHYWALIIDTGNWEPQGFHCDSGPFSPGPGYGPYGDELTDPAQTTLELKSPFNAWVTFEGGWHFHKCTISPMLPVGPAKDLPEGVVATLYVRVVAEEGTSDTHTVCFSTEGVENPVLYQFIAGEWVVVNAGGYGGQICTTHSGDGSFAMGSQ
ncbi:MAG: hypothetical protein WEA61_08055 [Anaerolineales bacterium]